jgi:putative ABC transport system permease protein
MFFATYLRRELRRRMRQAIFIALGLALGVGLVVTVAAASAGVTKAQAGAAKLAGDLGKWLAVVVLIAAFAVACLLTLAAVARRAREFGTLKALGWRTRRIVAQVLGESVVMGIAGAAVGVGLGFVGSWRIARLRPADALARLA